MADTKRDKLARMADPKGNASATERAKAIRQLAALDEDDDDWAGGTTLPAIRGEEADDRWESHGQLTRIRGGNRAYLRGTALKHFLASIKDGVSFTARDVPQNRDFGSGDLYVILSWLVKMGWASKMPRSSYVVDSRAKVRMAWNTMMDKTKI